MDTSSGAAVDRTLDFRLTGPLEFWWVRHYDSSVSHRRLALGWGHTHAFDRLLRCDLDGFAYVAPLGRVVAFPPLRTDGADAAREGYHLRRISLARYEVHHHGEPAMEFEFQDLQRPARLRRVFRGPDEIRFGYANGRWETITDSSGRFIRVAEDGRGRITNLTLERGPSEPGIVLVSYQYDERGNLIATLDSSGRGFTCVYDATNRMIRRIGRKGFAFHFSYDAKGRCIRSTGDGHMHEVQLDYDATGRVTKVTRADGGVWMYTFDEVGRLARVVDPLGGIQSFLRDATGRVAAELDPNGNRSRLVYDVAGAAIAKITPFGHRIALPEDPNGPDPRMHRVAANPAEYEYGRLLHTDDITLPSAGEAMALSLPPEARPLVVTRPSGHSGMVPFAARPLGPVWWPSPERGRVFDDLGRLARQEDEWGRARHWRYDASGNVAQYTDFDGSEWRFDCGTWHLRHAEQDPLGGTRRFSYNSAGAVAACTDAGGTVSEYSYDLRDRLVEVRRHGKVRDRYTRDPSGNLVAKHAADGRLLLQLEVGRGNVPVKRTLASGDEHALEYDRFGRCLVAASSAGRVEFGYDIFGNRCREKRDGRGIEQDFHSRWSPAEAVVLDRFKVRYDRGTARTVIITDPGGRNHRIRFHSQGIVERQFSNTSAEIAQYNTRGWCLFKCARGVGRGVWSRSFFWSGEGELRRVVDNQQGEVHYEYDAAHRLRRRLMPDGRVDDFELDGADNLVRQPGLDDVRLQPGNRLTSANGEGLAFNDRDHVATHETGAGLVQHGYDSRDQMVRVDLPSGLWEAKYDAFGRRTAKIWQEQITEYFWNTDQLIAEIQLDGRVRLYIYADPLALTPQMFLDYESIDAPPESGARYFIFTDQIGTPCLIENESGAEVWRAKIDPYGRLHVVPGASIDCNLRFPGHYFDSETGLHYNRFRYYDPVLGRYLQSDPWGVVGGYNLYAYRTNPLLRVDVRGLGEQDVPPKPQAEPDEETPPAPARPADEPEPTNPPTPVPVSDDEMWKQVFNATNNRQVTEGAIDPTTGQPVIARSNGDPVPPVIVPHLPPENLVPGTGDPRGRCGMPRAVQGVADANGGELPPGPIRVTNGGFRQRQPTPENPGGVVYKAPCENCTHISGSHPQIQPSTLPPGVPEGLAPGQEVPFTPPPEWADE